MSTFRYSVHCILLLMDYGTYQMRREMFNSVVASVGKRNKIQFPVGNQTYDNLKSI